MSVQAHQACASSVCLAALTLPAPELSGKLDSSSWRTRESSRVGAAEEQRPGRSLHVCYLGQSDQLSMTEHTATD